MKIYTVEQCSHDGHGIIAFYTDKADAVAHLYRIHEKLKKVLRHSYDTTPIVFRDDSILELNFDESRLKISTHMCSYYIKSYDEGMTYERLYDGEY